MTNFLNPIFVTGFQVWHEGNDGPSSGLVSDLLDGFHASTDTSPNTIPVRGSGGVIEGTITNLGGIAGFMMGPYGGLPTAGVADRVYFCTDTKTAYRDTGTTWVDLIVASGGSGTTDHSHDNYALLQVIDQSLSTTSHVTFAGEEILSSSTSDATVRWVAKSEQTAFLLEAVGRDGIPRLQVDALGNLLTGTITQQAWGRNTFNYAIFRSDDFDEDSPLLEFHDSTDTTVGRIDADTTGGSVSMQSATASSVASLSALTNDTLLRLYQTSINGKSLITFDYSGTNVWDIGHLSGDTACQNLYLYYNGTPQTTWTATGRVGFYTDSPEALVTVQSNTNVIPTFALHTLAEQTVDVFTVLNELGVQVAGIAPSGNATFAGTLHASGNATIGGTLTVTGASTLSAGADITGDIACNGNVGAVNVTASGNIQGTHLTAAGTPGASATTGGATFENGLYTGGEIVGGGGSGGGTVSGVDGGYM